MTNLSVITLVKNRPTHLNRLIDGLKRSEELPSELLVVNMGDDDLTMQQVNFASKLLPLSADRLPLAAARNQGAEEATGEHLLFLDVDCIPKRDLLSRMTQTLKEFDALVCAEVFYLGPGAKRFDTDDELLNASKRHPHRTFPEHGCRPESNSGFFWSTLFGIRRDTFHKLRGFDENYQGYGAEDTDFGFRAREAGVPLIFIGGTGAFHQYHGVTNPPLQHFDDIVRNAERFYKRWRIWPMMDWLQSFSDLKLISWHEDQIVTLRKPSRSEIEQARQPPSVYF